MKSASIACVVPAILLVVLNKVAEYWLGYSETPRAFAAAYPLTLLMAESVLFLILSALALWAIISKRQRLQVLSGLIGFWPLVILTFILTGHGGTFVLRGLHDRVMHDYTLDDLRRFAQEVDEPGFPQFGGRINYGDIRYLTDQQKAAFTRIRAKYPFMHWMDDGPSILNQGDDNVVNFAWGGGLTGCWGCSISVNGSRNQPNPNSAMTILRVSDDIYFFYGG